MSRILALIDGSIYAQSVCDLAAWAAGRIGAPVDLLHVVGRRDTPSFPADIGGSLVAAGQEILMAELAVLDEQRSRLARQRGEVLLDEARARIAAAGIGEVATHMKVGDLVDTAVALEEDARLVVIGKRGEAADFARLHLGSNLERVARASRRPILVAARAFRPINRFLLAFDGGPRAVTAVENIARSPLLRGIQGQILTVGQPDAAVRQKLDAAARLLNDSGIPVRAGVEPGYPEDVIADEVESEGIDLLVMGAYGHSRIRNLIIGSVTTAMVTRCKIPVLMFRGAAGPAQPAR